MKPDVDGYPRVCSGCGERVLKTRQAWWQESVAGVRMIWHMACRLASGRKGC